MRKKKIKEWLTGYSFLLPGFLLLALFIIVPILMVFFYSFTNLGANFQNFSYIGLKNYARIFKDPAISYAFKNTIIFVVGTVPISTVFALVVATLLAMNYQNKFGEFVRSAMFVPVVCSLTLLGTVWYYLFSSGSTGPINMLLSNFGVEPIDWLGETKTAMLIICFVMFIRNTGYFLAIFYAGIMDIPKGIMEASTIDGANKIQQALYVVFPNIKSTTYFVVSINTIWAFQIFDIVYVMTKGGPGYGTTTFIYRIYQEGFWNWKMGFACAISVCLFLLIVIVSAVIKRIFKEKVGGES